MDKSIKTDTQIQKAIKQIIKSGKQGSFPIVGYKGLELRVRPTKNNSATADFRHRYTHPYTINKRIYITLGTYPSFSLEQARTAHRDNMALLAKGVDPKTHRDSEKQTKAKNLVNTFETVASHWLAEQTSNTESMPSAKTLYNWDKYLEALNNEFGKQPIKTITSQQVINLCKRIQKNHIEKGKRTHGMANRIFAYAVLHDYVDNNPVSQTKGARVLKSQTTKSHPALINPKEFACLLNDIEQIDNPRQPFNKPILQLLALTFVRIGDICAMRWEDIDLNTKQWIFTPQKGRDRGDMVSVLIVPLAPQTIKILQAMQQITGAYDYVFYNHRRAKAPYHDQQAINSELNAPTMNKDGIGKDYQQGKGYKGVHSPHGFRASAKTMLMERLGYDELITEMQLGHRMLNKYDRAYNRMTAIKERTKMMTEWANYLDDIKAGKIGKQIFHDFTANEQTAMKTG